MSNTGHILVWDIGVRLFHWFLVASVTTAYFTRTGSYDLHLYAGYSVLGLLAFRFIWGFIGSEYARFTSFLFKPAVVLGYFRDMIKLRPHRYLGHNPAGGVMIVLLLLCLLVIAFSGIALDAGENRAGPLAGTRLILYKGTARDVHEGATSTALALIAVHLLGVLYSSLVNRENLLRAMITGRKPSPRDQAPSMRRDDK
jgi:cytochrome b